MNFSTSSSYLNFPPLLAWRLIASVSQLIVILQYLHLQQLAQHIST